MKQIKESNLNRILSHMKDKDIAMITAFRTDPELNLSKTRNRKRNSLLESKLNDLGYHGYTKIIGYWNEIPQNDDSEAVAEESYVILNTGSSFEDFVVDMVLLSKDVENSGLDQQAITVWDHENQKAYLIDGQGNITKTFNDFRIDLKSQGWSQIKGHKLTFVEESFDTFSDEFNKDGNFMTAMAYGSSKNKLRSSKNL